jgi:hypothetical protein
MIDNIEQFILNARGIITRGKVFQNPGGGTSRIISFTEDGRISYRRGESYISINIRDIIGACNHFCGDRCSSNDLKQYAPHIYDSKARPAGHDCNCTFFFMILKEMDLIYNIEGEGKANSPFYIVIKNKDKG